MDCVVCSYSLRIEQNRNCVKWSFCCFHKKFQISPNFLFWYFAMYVMITILENHIQWSQNTYLYDLEFKDNCRIFFCILVRVPDENISIDIAHYVSYGLRVSYCGYHYCSILLTVTCRISYYPVALLMA